MAMQRRFEVEHGHVFPAGAVMKGEVRPTADFDAAKREDGSRPQQLDKDSGLPLWEVVVADLDSEGNKSNAGVKVKIAASHQPVPPSPVQVKVPGVGSIPMQFVEFAGLTALPYVDDNGNRPVLAWSYKATGFAGVSGSPAAADEKAAA